MADWKLDNPGRYACIGPSQSGKSELVLKLIKYKSIWKNPPKYVQYIAPTLEDRKEYLTRLDEIVKNNGGNLTVNDVLPKNDENYNYNSFLIVDDVLSFPKKDIQRLKEIALRGSHHNKVTLILTQQVPHPQGDDFIAINKNLTGKFLLYQTSDIVGLQQISWRLFRKGNDFLIYCLYYAKDKLNTNYIFINMHPFTKIRRKNMCYTRIFPGENGPFFFNVDNYDWKDLDSSLKEDKKSVKQSVMKEPSTYKEVEEFLKDFVNRNKKEQKQLLSKLSHTKQVRLAKYLHSLNKTRDFTEEGEKIILNSKLTRQRNLFKKYLSSKAKFQKIKSNPYLLETTLSKIIPLIIAFYKAFHGRSSTQEKN